MPSPKSLTRNALYNTAGTVLPLFLSLLTIPLYLGMVGEARYGIIALVWLLFGYFGLFDLGLSKATANRLARPDNQAPARQSELFWTALVINTLLGCVGGAVLWLLAAPLLNAFAKIPPELAAELNHAIPWIACLLPLATTSAVFTGALEARERFLEINTLGLFGTALGQLMPIAAVYTLGPTIDVAIGATALARLGGMLPVAMLAVRQIGRQGWPRFSRHTVSDLFGYGGWVTTTNIVGPLLVSIDQFLIGAVVGVRAVTHYAIPFNLAMKVLILPAAMTRALFPQLSRMTPEDARQRAQGVAGTVALTLAMVCSPTLIVADHALQLWLGQGFSEQASTVSRLLLLGVWINGIAFIPYVLLESQGRPDVPAKFHLLELLPFVAILWLSLQMFGLPGAAVAWSVRVTADALLLCRAAGFTRALLRHLAPGLAFVLFAFAAPLLMPMTPIAAVAVAIALTGVIATWSYHRDATIKRLCGHLVSSVYAPK